MRVLDVFVLYIYSDPGWSGSLCDIVDGIWWCESELFNRHNDMIVTGVCVTESDEQLG